MISQTEAAQILQQLTSSSLQGRELRQFAMRLLDQRETYNWSGIYRLEGNQLILDEYVGAATDHARIPVGVGVCGTAVAEDENQIVEDVRQLENYLACSIQTRSEIVVLIRRDGEVLGQIDIDGHQVGAFDRSDEELLMAIADVLAAHWED